MKHRVRVTEPDESRTTGYRIEEKDIPTFIRIHVENGYGVIEITPTEEIEES